MPPIDRHAETCGHMRDPDRHLTKVGQAALVGRYPAACASLSRRDRAAAFQAPGPARTHHIVPASRLAGQL
jgi:hypothetical protein